MSGRNQGQNQLQFEDCFDALGEDHNESVYGAIERLILAGEQVGFSVDDLIRMLKGGLSLEALFDLIEGRMTGTCLNGESTAALRYRGVYANSFVS